VRRELTIAISDKAKRPFKTISASRRRTSVSMINEAERQDGQKQYGVYFGLVMGRGTKHSLQLAARRVDDSLLPSSRPSRIVFWMASGDSSAMFSCTLVPDDTRLTTQASSKEVDSHR
jgi:hypothetical protein